jgi:hypothetical protein
VENQTPHPTPSLPAAVRLLLILSLTFVVAEWLLLFMWNHSLAVYGDVVRTTLGGLEIQVQTWQPIQFLGARNVNCEFPPIASE